MVKYYYDKFTSIQNNNYTYDLTSITQNQYTTAQEGWGKSNLEVVFNGTYAQNTSLRDTVYKGFSISNTGAVVGSDAVAMGLNTLRAIYEAVGGAQATGAIQIIVEVVSSSSGTGFFTVELHRGSTTDANYRVAISKITTRLVSTTYSKGALVSTNAGEVGSGSTWTLPNPVSKKLVRLDNGWLIAAAVYPNSNIYLTVSKDNGVTWVQKGTIGNSAVRDISLISVGNTAVFSFSNGASIILYKWESATDGQPVYLGQLGGTASIMEFGISFFWDSTRNTLHVAYSQAYGASYAIYYAKITNNLQTFSTPRAIGPMNTSGVYHVTPTVLVDVSKGYVYLIAQYVGTSSRAIVAARSTAYGDNFTGFNYSIYDSFSGYTCEYPQAIIDNYGRLHVAFHYKDASNPTDHTLYKYSEDGLTWKGSTTPLRTDNNMKYPVLTVDKGNNLFMFGTTGNDQNVVLYTSSDRGDKWSQTAKSVKLDARQVHPLYDQTFKLTFGINNIMPIIYKTLGSPVGVYYEGKITTNSKPSVTLISPSDNQTLYENDTINLSGDAYDADKDQAVTVYYQIDSEQRKVLATNVSQKQITLSKQLTFKDGKLYDGETVLTGTLAEGVAHTLKVWAVDSDNSQSATIERTFYVVPNRAPLLAIDEIVPSGIINTDKFKINGTASDQDANSSVKVNYRINAANPIEIYTGTGGAWEFDLSLSQLIVGENTIIIEVIDNYGAKTSKTIKLNKNEVKTPVLQSVARYKISPPKGSARGVLIWVQRDEELDLKVELSMTLVGEQEQYVLLEADPDKIVPVTDGIVEDEYYHETVESKDNIILKLTTSRPNINIDNKIYLIMGVVE